MKRLLFPLGLTGILLSGHVAAEPLSLSCPTTIMTDQKVKALPEGWESSIHGSTAFPDEGHRRVSINFYSGPPNEGASLAPSQTRRRGKHFTSIWDLEPAAQKYWFACDYSQTKLLLSKQLPDRPLRCEARYSDQSNVPMSLVCDMPAAGKKR